MLGALRSRLAVISLQSKAVVEARKRQSGPSYDAPILWPFDRENRAATDRTEYGKLSRFDALLPHPRKP